MASLAVTKFCTPKSGICSSSSFAVIDICFLGWKAKLVKIAGTVVSSKFKVSGLLDGGSYRLASRIWQITGA